MKKTIIIFFALFSINFSVTAQINKDSLWAVWSDTKQSDTTRLRALGKFIYGGQVFSHPDSAFHFTQLYYDFAKSKGLKKHMADALTHQAASFFVHGEHAKALAYNISSLAIYEDIGNKNGIAGASNKLGLIYQELSDYATAINYLMRSLTIRKETGDRGGTAGTLNNIGSIYYNQGDHDKALDYFNSSLSILEEFDDERRLAITLNNIGEIYGKQENYSKALTYYTRSLAIKKKNENKKGITTTLTNIGCIYEAKGDSARIAGNIELSDNYFTRAMNYNSSSLSVAEEIGDKREIASSLNGIGSIYYKRGNYANALKYFSRSLKIAQDVDYMMLSRDVAHQLYQVYKATDRVKPALEMYELYISTRDSINREENQREVLRHEYKYEYDKKTAIDSIAYVEQQKVQEAKLEKTKTQALALIGGLVLLLVFLGLLYGRYRLIKKQKSTILIQNSEIESSLEKLKSAQSKLIQSEKMASLGVLTAGIAHEINNPINFISSGAHSLDKDLLHILNTLKSLPQDGEALKESAEIIRKLEEEYAFDDIIQFIPQTIEDIKEGVNRTAKIIKGLLLYSRNYTSEQQMADIHEDIEASLVLLRDKYKDSIEIIKNYDHSIGKMKCFHGQLSQLFTNFIDNAIDAIEDKGTITITTVLKNKT